MGLMDLMVSMNKDNVHDNDSVLTSQTLSGLSKGSAVQLRVALAKRFLQISLSYAFHKNFLG